MREQDPDKLLNEALKSYADPGPNSGLEDRILANVDAICHTQAPRAPRRPVWLWFAIATPAACIVLLGYSLFVHRTIEPAHAPVIVARSTPQTPPPLASTNESAVHNHAVIHAARKSPRKPESSPSTAALPKLAVFPTVPSLTPAERALLEWQKHAPERERKAFLQAQAQPEQPQDIAAIRIPPLEMPDLDSH